MPIRGEGLAADGDEMGQDERIVYVLHPNYATDDVV